MNELKSWQGRFGPPRTTKAVYFDWFGVPHGFGVSVMDLCARSVGAIADDMVGGYDQDFTGLGLKTLNFRIAWPGYAEEWIRPIQVHTDYGILYRADLAAHIASQFSRYCEKAEYENIHPSEAQWRISISGKGIQFRHIHLVSVVNLYGDVWQADITVAPPHQR
ncbi:hypothetical protein EWM64_g7977 [Hericium alpestre]|uniref:Uncharacterized protein n=1 Tax=Hericium alpestre TaxID=135208 RepID=A0A4Y9ZN47_9AGAM|nr:hypothetical protein EWM64_g7977 [Hericium alpestre]